MRPSPSRSPTLLATIVAGALVLACAPPASDVAPTPALTNPPCCIAEGRQIADRYLVGAITTRRFTHAELWRALEPSLASASLRVAEIGRSVQGRPIRAITFGRGETTVLLWSQMHGDESTATMALVDIIAWLAAATPDPLRQRLVDQLTVVMVPMLNPDGAELFQRENAVGVDVNRDARQLATPEARALKALRDSIGADFGFNLHDQGARILTGDGGRQVAIALLAPAADERREFTGARAAARLVAAEIATVLASEVPGRVAKYEDDFTPRAFGDLMQQWGTSTVLIESGALPDDPEKQRLRAVNVVAIVSALDAIGTGRYRQAATRAYDVLPTNERNAVDVLVRGGMLVLPGVAPLRVDLALNYEEPVARLRPRVREVGDLATVVALDTVDATGLFVHPGPSMLTERAGVRWLRINAPAAFTLRRGAALSSALVSTVGDSASRDP